MKTELELMTTLAEMLRGELLYVHQTNDVADSIRNSRDILNEAERLLGPPESDA